MKPKVTEEMSRKAFMALAKAECIEDVTMELVTGALEAALAVQLTPQLTEEERELLERTKQIAYPSEMHMYQWRVLTEALYRLTGGAK